MTPPPVFIWSNTNSSTYKIEKFWKIKYSSIGVQSPLTHNSAICFRGFRFVVQHYVSYIRSRVYLGWEIEIPLLVLATSISRKQYIRFSRSLILNILSIYIFLISCLPYTTYTVKMISFYWLKIATSSSGRCLMNNVWSLLHCL